MAVQSLTHSYCSGYACQDVATNVLPIASDTGQACAMWPTRRNMSVHFGTPHPLASNYPNDLGPGKCLDLPLQHQELRALTSSVTKPIM